MGRRKKGRAVHGWVIIDKPAGKTSTDIVGKVRWAFNAQKAGHSGTLDPDATGVLAVALGEATKTVPYVTDAKKGYDFRVVWGSETTTDDASGNTIRTADARPSDDQIADALSAYRGDIMQVPPQVSAVKVDGERAYDLAREGVEMDLVARPLHVASLDLIDADESGATLRMVCGKGGYVRSIARDLGRDLGCLGHVAWLRRTFSGPFDLDQAVSVDDIERLARTEEIDSLLHPLEVGLADLPSLLTNEAGATRLRNGNPGDVIESAEYGDTVWASLNGEAVAVGTYRAGQVHPSRVFVR